MGCRQYNETSLTATDYALKIFALNLLIANADRTRDARPQTIANIVQAVQIAMNDDVMAKC